ncbi:MAG: hypothetical protein ACI9BV_003768 [Rhodothermales bacterium]|jgi:hypothetical protein
MRLYYNRSSSSPSSRWLGGACVLLLALALTGCASLKSSQCMEYLVQNPAGYLSQIQFLSGETAYGIDVKVQPDSTFWLHHENHSPASASNGAIQAVRFQSRRAGAVQGMARGALTGAALGALLGSGAVGMIAGAALTSLPGMALGGLLGNSKGTALECQVPTSTQED